MALEGTLCALLLAVLAGVCVWEAGPPGAVEPRRATLTQGAPRPQSVDAGLPGRQELVGVHEPALQGQLELPRPAGKPSPSAPRFTPRHALAPRPQARLPLCPEWPRWGPAPERHGRQADRPLLANCPAQGPPRTA